jgi:hypothetical protein
VGTRFDAGELVRIDNVKVGTFSGLDLNFTVVEPFRLSWQDGPFEVHEQRRCRVQLHFDVSRDVRKERRRTRPGIAARWSLIPRTGSPRSGGGRSGGAASATSACARRPNRCSNRRIACSPTWRATRNTSRASAPARARVPYVTGSGADSRGWADGQLVAWAAQLARALQECYLEE